MKLLRAERVCGEHERARALGHVLLPDIFRVKCPFNRRPSPGECSEWDYWRAVSSCIELGVA